MPRAVIVSPSEIRFSFRSGRRLHRPDEFAAVMATRQAMRGTRFDLHIGPANDAGRARLGLIVPKRLARAATLRNAIKRQGREAFRLLADGVPSRDLVLRLTRPVGPRDRGEGSQRKAWRAEIETLFRRFLA